MKIPFSMRIGRRKYAIHEVGTVTKNMGWTLPAIALLQIAVHRLGKRRKPDDIAETFWHETTHAILYEMGSPLWHNEKFVTEFSKLLAQAIRTAEFQ